MRYTKLFLILIVLLAGILRFYRIQNVPPGLYIDEVSSAYNGYSVFQTGKDEHGKSYPLWFEAFGEYKMPGLIYATGLSTFILGKSEFAVRLPSALLGTLTVLLLYFLLEKLLSFDRKLFFRESIFRYLPLLSSFLLAIAPWHIQFSRGAFDATLALFFYTGGFLLYAYYWGKRRFTYLLGSFLLFSLTLYTYNAYRITSVITLLILTVLHLQTFPNLKKHILTSGIIVILLMMPVVQFSLTGAGVVRFAQTSAFTELKNVLFVEKIVQYPSVYIKNYLSYFSPNFLFVFGDGIGRHQIPGWGVLYRWMWPFLLIGLYGLLKNSSSFLTRLTILLFLLAPLSAALAVPSPHSLRSLLMVIPITITLAAGLLLLLNKFWNKRFLLGSIIGFIILFEFAFYLHYYYFHYPKVNILDWGAGNKEIVETVKKYEKTHKHIVIERDFRLTYIYFLFYDARAIPLAVDLDWKKPKEWQNEKVLFIRRRYDGADTKNIIDRVRISNQNNDVVAEFWEL
jgi:4-amino-4-deoxy-L-arabinose transferase-like glycosyltransferase